MVGFVHHHNTIVTVGELFEGFTAFNAEFENQREDIGAIGLQILPKFFFVGRSKIVFFLIFGFDNGFGFVEISVNLTVQIPTVGNDQKGPVARDFSVNLFREKNHRIRFARSLRVPENAQLSFVGVFALQSPNGIVHAEIPVIFGKGPVQTV